MSATSRTTQLTTSLHTPGISGDEWVSGLLRQAANTEKARPQIAGMLAVGDLLRILHWTENRVTARDRRTHETVRLELERRGLLDPPVWRRREAFDTATDSECPDVA
jgi:hypothetical protein